ncbi:hypothetical protein C453_10430 [Haloferax elongans ATCC BAA-1513]|uniref:Uncharacterized protein n=1 Tax=Haloferax elongans ATCC BAA-1513 TaxID=1230453 RepID=M0HKB9_HALEO|nr:hypothetical protein [Haloferax elongans]ELZ84990.1 hypothetical protein C453_10430 [Haloferax elongans ATCC BAA-1513]
MSDERDDTDDAKQLQDALEKVDFDELTDSLAEGIHRAIEMDEDVESGPKGPANESEYVLHQDRLPSDRYHELARIVTKEVLSVSPRAVAEVEVGGIADFLRNRDETAVETLLENGASYVESATNDGTIEGRCSANPGVVEAVLTVYMPGLWQAHFLDAEGEAIAARYDDRVQHYWLPEPAYAELGERLDSDLFSAVVPRDR